MLGDSVRDLAAGRCFRFDVVNVIEAIVFQRVLDPGSERPLVQFLAEVGRELEARLTRVMTEKLFADATLVLFDTTSTYFECGKMGVP